VFVETKLLRSSNEGPTRVKQHFFQQSFGIVSHWLLIRTDNCVRLCIAKLYKQRRATNEHFKLVSRYQNSLACFRQTPARRNPFGFCYCPGMILRGDWLTEGRADAHQIGRQNCHLDLRVVLAVENNGFFGLGEISDRTDLFQFSNVLRRGDCYQTNQPA